MRSSRATGRTDVAEHVARPDMVAFLCREARHVQVNGLDALSVIDRHRAAAQIPFPDNPDDSGGDGMNRRSGRAALIDAGVKIARQPSIMESSDPEQGCQAALDGRLERLSPITNRRNGLAERADGLLLAGRRL